MGWYGNADRFRFPIQLALGVSREVLPRTTPENGRDQGACRFARCDRGSVVNLNRTVLRDQVKEILLKRILDGEYKPGDRLVEMHIAQEFEISQAPVREALRELEALGFVESEPYRGTHVRAVTKSELTEIYPVRAALEEVAARAAALRLENVEALEAELRAMHA